ncbi:calcium-transporting ATPasesarcoplasmic/endoplasmic reticulum type [Striga asiatica]|uniref:Calcium-transporting ATPasesarcoplasmic/endoplasmic reticulum type n=1 Tax=Striga asiatica TaxID=4170 RepID=A0A5A7RG90_STRAF|nr:calcium-transporting ATPasesarcoplasmic/endoplasmic reticulum type [Striga asiatica]
MEMSGSKFSDLAVIRRPPTFRDRLMLFSEPLSPLKISELTSDCLSRGEDDMEKRGEKLELGPGLYLPPGTAETWSCAAKIVDRTVSSPTIIVERAGSHTWAHRSWRVREEIARTITSAISLFGSTELPLQLAILPHFRFNYLTACKMSETIAWLKAQVGTWHDVEDE